jgi:hypothetical protein
MTQFSTSDSGPEPKQLPPAPQAPQGARTNQPRTKIPAPQAPARTDNQPRLPAPQVPQTAGG